jgi:hypothetical protein
MLSIFKIKMAAEKNMTSKTCKNQYGKRHIAINLILTNEFQRSTSFWKFQRIKKNIYLFSPSERRHFVVIFSFTKSFQYHTVWFSTQK